MTTGRITLEAWIAQTYEAACAPKLNTVRRWARDNKLDPPAAKEGRAYFVEPHTRYTDGSPASKPKRLLDKVRAAEAARSEERRPAR